jgi:hypothetical protein
MAGFTAEEIALLQERLAEAASSERMEALTSAQGFRLFLERVGIAWLIEKLPGIVANVRDWLREILEPLLDAL